MYFRIKQGILQALVNEQEKLVKNAIAQFIGIIGKHEFPNKTWPEVLQFVQSLCGSENMLDREVHTVHYINVFLIHIFVLCAVGNVYFINNDGNVEKHLFGTR